MPFCSLDLSTSLTIWSRVHWTKWTGALLFLMAACYVFILVFVFGSGVIPPTRYFMVWLWFGPFNHQGGNYAWNNFEILRRCWFGWWHGSNLFPNVWATQLMQSCSRHGRQSCLVFGGRSSPNFVERFLGRAMQQQKLDKLTIYLWARYLCVQFSHSHWSDCSFVFLHPDSDSLSCYGWKKRCVAAGTRKTIPVAVTKDGLDRFHLGWMMSMRCLVQGRLMMHECWRCLRNTCP